MLAHELAAVVGVGAVADHVAQAPDLDRRAGGDVLEHRLEGVPVAVDVGDDRDLHLSSPAPCASAGRRSAAVVAAIAVAEAAAMLLRPRTGLVDPAPVKAEWYFSPAEIDRARSVPPAAAGAVRRHARGPGRGARRLRADGRRACRRPPRARRCAVSLSRRRCRWPRSPGGARWRVGLVTQSWGGWAATSASRWRSARSRARRPARASMALVRRLGPRWWLAGRRGGGRDGRRLHVRGPVVLAPLFNRFTDLPPGPARDDVLELAGRAGLKVGQRARGRRARGARPPPTRTSPGSGRRSGSSSTTP